jgi:hypothetical protein
LVRGLAALALASAGEAIIRRHPEGSGGGVLYLAAIALFAWDAWRRTPASPEAVEDERPRGTPFLVVGCLASAALELLLVRELNRGADSTGSIVLWTVGALLPMFAGIVASRATAFAPRWDTSWRPAEPRRRAVLYAVLFGILAIGAAARLWNLASIPFGINPDEGDRAALAMQIVRGYPVPSVFGVGWYRLNMLCFYALAGVMRFTGLTVAGARVWGALCGIGTLATVTLLALRHFGRRAGILAAALLAGLGVALEFSRIVTEAGPTALLWSLSALFFLEAACRGRAWAWAGAGLFGGLSAYFYPSGRLWAVIAALFSLLLIAKGLKGTRFRLASGVAVATLSAFAVMTPFFFHTWKEPHEFALRAQETTVLRRENAERLSYYRKEWSMPRLMREQVVRSIGIFDRYGDANGVYPTDEPIFPAPLAVLTLVGIGAALLHVRDERFALLSLWFVLGFIGVVVTVETPNLHRMSTTVPALPIFAAVVLDDLARRGEAALGSRVRKALPAIFYALAGVLALSELSLYFKEFARLDRWGPWRLDGKAVHDQGSGTLVMSLASSHHMVNSGWNRLLAPESQRAGIPFPGRDLPLDLPGARPFAFLIYPRDLAYSLFIQDVYPGGTVTNVLAADNSLVLQAYRVEKPALESERGALVSGARVPALGDAPPGEAKAPLRWTASLRVPRHANYAFRVTPSPARLEIDGVAVADDSFVSLAQGWHFVTLEAPGPRRVEWRRTSSTWEPIPASALHAAARATGLHAVFDAEERFSGLERLDAAITSSGVCDEFVGLRDLLARWEGNLIAPETGTYELTLAAAGEASVLLDGQTMLSSPGGDTRETRASVPLSAGPHPIRVALHVHGGAGAIELLWKRPGHERSVIPPSAFSPPKGSGIGAPLPPKVEAARYALETAPALRVVP